MKRAKQYILKNVTGSRVLELLEHDEVIKYIVDAIDGICRSGSGSWRSSWVESVHNFARMFAGNVHTRFASMRHGSGRSLEGKTVGFILANRPYGTDIGSTSLEKPVLLARDAVESGINILGSFLMGATVSEGRPVIFLLRALDSIHNSEIDRPAIGRVARAMAGGDLEELHIIESSLLQGECVVLKTQLHVAYTFKVLEYKGELFLDFDTEQRGFVIPTGKPLILVPDQFLNRFAEFVHLIVSQLPEELKHGRELEHILVYMGRTVDGRHLVPVALRPFTRESVHALVVGATGSGKSTEVAKLLAGYAMLNERMEKTGRPDSDKINILIFDPQGEYARWFSNQHCEYDIGLGDIWNSKCNGYQIYSFNELALPNDWDRFVEVLDMLWEHGLAHRMGIRQNQHIFYQDFVHWLKTHGARGPYDALRVIIDQGRLVGESRWEALQSRGLEDEELNAHLPPEPKWPVEDVVADVLQSQGRLKGKGRSRGKGKKAQDALQDVDASGGFKLLDNLEPQLFHLPYRITKDEYFSFVGFVLALQSSLVNVYKKDEPLTPVIRILENNILDYWRAVMGVLRTLFTTSDTMALDADEELEDELEDGSDAYGVLHNTLGKHDITQLVHQLLSEGDKQRGRVVIFNLASAPEAIYGQDIGYILERLRSIMLYVIFATIYSESQKIYRSGSNKKVNTLVIIDEAHRVIPKSTDKSDVSGPVLTKLKNLISKALRETRKFGLGYMLISTSIETLDAEVVRSSRSRWFGAGLNTGEDFKVLKNYVSDEALKDYLTYVQEPVDNITGNRKHAFLVWGRSAVYNKQGDIYISFNADEFLMYNGLNRSGYAKSGAGSGSNTADTGFAKSDGKSEHSQIRWKMTRRLSTGAEDDTSMNSSTEPSDEL